MPADLKDIFVTEPMLPSLEQLVPLLEDIWARKYVTNFGHYHNQLEGRLAEILAASHFSLFSNGTLGLLITLKAMDLTGEVIVTPFTFPATVTCLEWAGLTPVYCDIDDKTMCIDANQIESLITDNTCAILGVHVYGIPCDVYKIQHIAEKYHLKVIYDGAHAFLATVEGKPIADFGDATMFSFHATKLFNTIEGGGVVFNDPALKEKADRMKNFGFKNGIPVVTGINAKLNELQAAIGLANLDQLNEERDKRLQLQQAYDELLKPWKGIKTYSSLMSESLQYYPITIEPHQFGMTRDELSTLLNENQIFPRKYFSPLCNEYTFMKSKYGTTDAPTPIARKIVDNILCLPFYGNLLDNDFARIKQVFSRIGTK